MAWPGGWQGGGGGGGDHVDGGGGAHHAHRLNGVEETVSEDKAELGWTGPECRHLERSILRVEFPLVALGGTLLVQAVTTCSLHLLQPVAVEQDHDHLLHRGLLADEQALVLALLHQHAVMDLHQPALPLLQSEPALPPRVAQLQLRRLRVFIEHQSLLGQAVPARFLDHHLEGEVEELWVSVFHLELGQQLPDHCLCRGGMPDRQGLVFNVSPEARRKHFYGGLRTGRLR